MSHTVSCNGSRGLLKIEVATGLCRYGALLVANSAQGICDIHLGQTEDDLVQAYTQDLPSYVKLERATGQPGWLTEVLKLTEEPSYSIKWPLCIEGTSFQTAVWRALTSVPVGHTTTYKALAETIGRPKSFRAVGNACGANRLALVIPCHRALRKGSGPLDYRWGRHVKVKILAAEAAWMFEA